MHRTPIPLSIYAVAFLIFLYGPILLLPVFSVNDSIITSFPLKGFTLRHYVTMANEVRLLDALRNSVVVGIVVSVISTALGLLGAIAATRYQLPGRGSVMGAIMLPLVVPSIIFGVALLVILRRIFDIELSLFTVGAGHVLLAVPFAMLVLISRLEGFEKSLEEASSDLGERPWMTFWRVTFPLALPGIVSSLLLCFTISFDEFVLAFFLSGTEQTLPIFLFSQLRFPQRLPPTLALGSAILLVSTIIVVFSEILRRRGLAPGRGSEL
jgi:spermidine/putrescine transport system permease protein